MEKNKAKILIADDDFFLRQLEAEVLRCAGYEVDEVEDGGAAWDLLQRKNYDLLITDNQMPMVSGMELLRLVHAARIPLPIIMTTGSLPAWKSAGDTFFQPLTTLFKPYTIAELLAVVQEQLHAKAGAGNDALPSSLQRQPFTALIPVSNDR